MSKQLSDFLSTTPGETPEAKTITNGVYDFVVQGYRKDEVGEDNKTKITVFLKPQAVVGGDFNPEELEYANRVRMEFWGTVKALASSSPVISLKQHLKVILELGDEIEGMSYAQLLEMATGRSFRAEVREGMSGKNNDIPIAQVVRIVR